MLVSRLLILTASVFSLVLAGGSAFANPPAHTPSYTTSYGSSYGDSAAHARNTYRDAVTHDRQAQVRDLVHYNYGVGSAADRMTHRSQNWQQVRSHSRAIRNDAWRHNGYRSSYGYGGYATPTHRSSRRVYSTNGHGRSRRAYRGRH